MAYTEDDYPAQILRDLGDRGLNAVWELVFPVDSVGGTWTLDLAGALSQPIERFASSAQVQSVLEELPSLGAGNLKAALGSRGFVLEFTGALAAQAIPAPLPDGSALELPGEIAVKATQDGAAPLLWDDVQRLWARNDEIPDLELRFYHTRLQALEEFLGLLQMQIDQKTGDVQRAYSQQFKQAASRKAGFVADFNAYRQPSRPGYSHYGVVCSQPCATTPNGLPYGQMGLTRGGFR